MLNLDDLCLTEYGVPATCEGARQFARATRGPHKPPIRSPGEYAAVVRRVAQRTAVGITQDGRLLAVGHNCLSPRDFLAIHDEWIAYWERAVRRPGIVGSVYNPPPERVWQCFRAGVPAAVCLSTEGLRYLRRVPTSRDARGSLLRRHIRIGRAMRRDRYLRYTNYSATLLEALGRLCPELQRVAVSTLPPYSDRTLRVRDVDWSIVAREQRRMLERPNYRLVWARGKRMHWLRQQHGWSYPFLLQDDVDDLRLRGAPGVDDVLRRQELREYKVLTQSGSSCHGGDAQWSLPRLTEYGEQLPGKWMPERPASVCCSGWHLTSAPSKWLSGAADTVYLAEGAGTGEARENKIAYSTARLLRRVPRPDVPFDAEYWAWWAQDIWDPAASPASMGAQP
jgi:hypothetical protein